MENNERNYIKEYYSKQEHNLKELVENIDLTNEEEIKSIKKEISKLQNQMDLKKTILSKIIEKSYNKQYTPINKKILISYKSNRNNNTYYYDLMNGCEEDNTDNSIIYEVYNKTGNVRVLVGYDYDLASLITKEYSYKISKDNDNISTKFLKENIISFMENKVVSYSYLTDTIIEEENIYKYSSYLDPLNNVNDYDFINTFYGVDYKGKLSIKELRQDNLQNKSFEIILKTCPSEIVDNLLNKVLEESLPIHKILGINIDTYNMAIERNMIKDLYENIELIKGEKDNGINKTEKEWLDFLEEMKTYEEDLKFYNISCENGYWYSRKGNSLSSLILSSYCENEVLKEYYTLGKYSNYVVNETINQGYDRVYDFINELTDYLNMCKHDNIKPTLYSSYLKQTHDITSRNHKVIVEQENEEIFKSRYENFKTYYNSGYCVVAPKDSNDLKKEGDNLNHCVASYIKRVIDGECLIYFLRKDKEESLITFEVRHNTIVQVRGLHNRKPSKSEIDALSNFAKARNLEVNF